MAVVIDSKMSGDGRKRRIRRRRRSMADDDDQRIRRRYIMSTDDHPHKRRYMSTDNDHHPRKLLVQQQQPIEKLCDDVLTNILIRLPAKQLGRMRCVSKPLYSLLSQPCFINSHLHRNLIRNKNKANEILLVLNHTIFSSGLITAHPSTSPNIQLNDLIKLPPNFPRPNSECSVIGSVHGLICFKCGFDYQCFDLYIWNPSLSAVICLPQFTPPSSFHEDLHFIFRFAFDPKSNDYKVVKLVTHCVPPMQVEVYSMRTGTWEFISETFPSKLRPFYNENHVRIAGHDGHIYWLCRANHDDYTIVAFDLGTHTFYEISLPDSISKSQGINKVLGFFDGKLCVASYTRFVAFEMWVMNEHGVTESWMKHYVLSHLSCNIDHMGFTPNNEFLFRAGNDPLALYDPDTTKVKYFEPGHAHYNTNIVQYVDSLVWITPTN